MFTPSQTCECGSAAFIASYAGRQSLLIRSRKSDPMLGERLPRPRLKPREVGVRIVVVGLHELLPLLVAWGAYSFHAVERQALIAVRVNEVPSGARGA